MQSTKKPSTNQETEVQVLTLATSVDSYQSLVFPGLSSVKVSIRLAISNTEGILQLRNLKTKLTSRSLLFKWTSYRFH